MSTTVNLTPNTGTLNIDGVPPGAKAVEFNSTAMWDSVNNYKVVNSGILGEEHTDYKLAASFLKGLDLNMTVAELDSRIAKDATDKTLDLATRDIRSELSGRISGVTEDGRIVGDAALVAANAAQTQDKGITS